MIEKNKILESWIMVEHLSEGDIGLNDKAILTLNDLQEQDFYSLFLHKIEKKKWNRRQKGGVVVYFDIFKFQEVVDILHAEYGLESTDEDIRFGDKFSFALYFDKNLNFLEDMTFFTESAYIRKFKKVPYEKEFREFEKDFKNQLAQDFDETAGDLAKFNAAMQKELLQHEVDIINCRMKILGNIETEATNLHSFFIDDLEKAKKIETVNLNAYLYGNKKERMNLDSKKDSVNFHPHLFEQILQPKNYPLGRFPSNTTYALSLMQQVAVNLSIGFDNNQMRSVNGPPGTGKTTLRKFRTTAADGKNYNTIHYNLDMIISLGYRVKSKIATNFRRWAAERLKEYMIKGFTMDDERLKNLGGGNYWKELLDRIRDIRSSEKVMYRQVLDLYATSVDYDPKSSESIAFFKMVQNKLHYAAHGHTAAEVIYERADASQPFMGLKSFSGDFPVLKDISIAKNYLNDEELKMPYALDYPYADCIYITVLVPEEEYITQTGNESAMYAAIDAKKGEDKQIKEYIDKNILKENDMINVFSVLDMKESFQRYVSKYYMIGSFLVVILAFIGIMNFFNTTATSVISRKKELALLEVVGMTKKQVSKMLVTEGFLYLGGAFVIAVLLIVFGAKQILVNTLGTAFFFRLHLTIVPCVLMIPILVGIAYVIPKYQFEKMSRESIVERIRKE